MRCAFSKLIFITVGLALSFVATAQTKSPVIAFASDTQEPMWIEKLFLKQDHNLQATKMIFKDVDTLRPAALFILGDVVSLGKSKAAWSNIDKYITQLRKDSIPVFATLGNHEVMFNAAKGTQNFLRRFPLYKPAGYAEIVDSVAVVLLNSNFATMNSVEITAQDSWYKQELTALDKDPAVKLIIVGCHHSPYTNSTIVNPSVLVQQHFVEPFQHAAKCVLFASGHSHNYERFKVKGKDFLVIGGGGGLHQPLRANNDLMHDLSADYKPAFHYLKISRLGNTLQVTSRELKSDFSRFQDGFSFSINSASH
ncbi:metallophosphoesterase [Mucilaginibacter sp. dw_454]|uniref:metallophosphoesterase family protein n=1 Tax=Mucilaginibacter sp. dw_454 TaxID=2720079 RepID=UPI001BD47C6C|nr:metallophosphoesterase [Mucilaginibacter sp. dw_454]